MFCLVRKDSTLPESERTSLDFRTSRRRVQQPASCLRMDSKGPQSTERDAPSEKPLEDRIHGAIAVPCLAGLQWCRVLRDNSISMRLYIYPNELLMNGSSSNTYNGVSNVHILTIWSDHYFLMFRTPHATHHDSLRLGILLTMNWISSGELLLLQNQPWSVLSPIVEVDLPKGKWCLRCRWRLVTLICRLNRGLPPFLNLSLLSLIIKSFQQV